MAKYSEFVHRIDLDALYEALDWEPITRRGDEDLGYCLDPWGLHANGDTTGKLAINRSKKVAHCFVCQGQSLLSLVMGVKDLSVQDATQWLSQFAHERGQSPDSFLAELDRMFEPKPEEVSVTPFFNVRVLDAWINNKTDWYSDRKILSEVKDFFRLGYDPEHTRYTKKGEYTGPAIILPHFWKGRLVGWQERWLDKDRPKYIPKYTNTGDFPRKETVWGWDFAQDKGQVYVVESVPTALFLISEGYPAVATFGASISESQIKLLRVFQEGVILAPDNDSPGEGWTEAIGDYVSRYVPVYTVGLVEGHGSDLGDLPPGLLEPHLLETLRSYKE